MSQEYRPIIERRSRPSWRALLVISLAAAWQSAPVAGQQISSLAALDNGGHVVFFTSQYDSSSWKIENLIDGSSDSGWASQNAFPQAVVLAFQDNKLATIEDILINPYTREASTNWAKEIEIQVSTTYPFRDFRSLGQFTVKNEGRSQLLPLAEPVQARYVKVLFLSNYKGSYMEAGEVQIMGRLMEEVSSAPSYTNVAAAANGATTESYTSQYDASSWAVSNLLQPDGGQQWAGTSSQSQEIIIALPEVTEFTDIAVNNFARENSSNWAKEVAVEVSTTSSYKGFTSVGKITMPQTGDLHNLALETPARAKYIKFFFRSNHGGSYMEACRLRLFQTEGSAKTNHQELAQQLVETGRAVVHEIRFATNSAQILTDSEAVLSQIATVLKDNSSMELIIEGHTDNVGGDQFNLDLSRRRAEAVKNWLVDRAGIAALRLTTVGYGLTQAIADNVSEAGRAQNRRVELKVKR